LLKTLGYNPFTSDMATYYSIINKIIMITYVDDCFFVGPSITKINVLKAQLAKVYDIEDLGPTYYFLGVKIYCDRSCHLLWIN